GQLKHIGVQKVSSSAREGKKKSWTTWDQLRNRRGWGPGGQLKRIGVRKAIRYRLKSKVENQRRWGQLKCYKKKLKSWGPFGIS
ncbi:unnamed protein product, partial [Prunus brigantina]